VAIGMFEANRKAGAPERRRLARPPAPHFGLVIDEGTVVNAGVGCEQKNEL